MNNEEDGVYEICGYLYQSAAKCNRYMDVETSYKGSKQQQQNEKKVCNFVESLIENNYDEYGEIIQQGDAWEIAKWKQVNAFKGDIVTRASKVQILGMVFSIGLCLSLFGYSFYLRHKLMHRRAWRHGMWTHQRAEEAGRVARASSGITMQRSLSANFTDPSFSQSGSFA